MLEALKVILLHCLYRRDSGVAVNPKLLLCALGLFVRTPTDKDILVILKALQQWIAGLRGNRWDAAAYVCGDND